MGEALNRTTRYHSLDALRAFALLLGIVFHAAESFCPDRRSWAIIDRNAHMVFDLFQYVCHSFRMEIFFLIAGFFAHLLIRRAGEGGFLRNRAQRIALPLVAGWCVFYPLMMLIWMWGKSSSGSLADFGIPPEMHHWGPFHLTAGLFLQGIFLHEAFNLVHLWFLYYLLLLYVLAFVVRLVFQRADRRGRLLMILDHGFARVFRSPWKLLFFALITLPLTTLMGGGVDTPNSSLIPHIPVLGVYGIFFTVGWMLHRQPGLLDRLPWGWAAHLAAGAALGALSYFPRTILRTLDPTGAWLRWASAIHTAGYPFMMWSFVFGVSGLFIALRREENRWWRYLADSSYWLYLLHPVVVVPLQILAADIDAGALLKLLAINGVAFSILFASYHFLVRSTFIGVILNGRKLPGGVTPVRNASPAPTTRARLQTAG